MDAKLKSPCVVKLERMAPTAGTPVKQLALSAELRKVINDRNLLTGNSRKKILVALDEIDSKKRADEKHNALVEILSSELVYISQIELIKNFFMKPICEDHLLKTHEFDILFGNINSIYQLNGALLNELRVDLMHLTSAFNKMAPFLKLYSEYAFNYKNVMDTLDELMHKKPEFARFIQGQETRPEVQKTLASLLIAPIQRIPRYCLLIKKVLDNTDPKDKDFEVLQETYKKLSDVAKHIDSAVEERQNFEKLLLLAKRVKHGKALIIKPGRRMIKEGIMKVYQPRKANTSIYMILFSDIIMFCTIRKAKVDEARSLKCMTIFPLRKCSITQKHNLPKMIVIRCEEETMTVYSEHGLTVEWVTLLKATLKDHIANRSTLRKDSSSRRPAVRTNFEDYKDHGVSPGVSGLRRKRRLTADQREDQDPQKETQENVPEVKKAKFVECRKSIRSVIPKLAMKSKSLLNGKSRFSNTLTQSKGREIDNFNGDSGDEGALTNSDKKDALFPLRAHLLQPKYNGQSQLATSSRENSDLSSKGSQYDQNVFVFGRENESRSFSFTGVLSGISNSFKRVFGFRSS